MPIASVSTAINVKPGCLINIRTPKRMSWNNVRICLVRLFWCAIWIGWFPINLDDLISFVLDPLQLPTTRRFDPRFGLQNAGIHIVDIAISQPLLSRAVLSRLDDRFIAELGRASCR